MRYRRSYRRPHKSRFVEMFGNYGANLNLEMSELANRIKVAFVGTCAKYYTESTNGVPMVRTTNITEHGLDLSDLKYVTHDFHKKNVKSQLHTGDLLIARFGSNGLSCLYSGGEANCLNAIIIEPNTATVMPVFLLHLINSQYVQRQISNNLVGSTFAILNTKSLAKLRVCLPPLTLQREFAAFVEKVDKLAFAVRKSLESAEKLYRQQLSEAFAC